MSNRNCNGCNNFALYPYSTTCIECGSRPDNHKRLSHADELRSMNDEELAKWCCGIRGPCPPDKDPIVCLDEEYAHGRGPYVPIEKCHKCWSNWLKEEVNETVAQGSD